MSVRLALALLLLTSPIAAQCDLRARRFDSPLSYGQFAGWDMARWQWHTFHAGSAVLYTEVIHRTTGWSRRVSGVVVPLVSVALHVFGASRGYYGVNWRDWLFDAGIRTLPLVLASRDRPVAFTAYAAFYAAAACEASP